MKWRLLQTFDASPELAMGLDEALLERAGGAPTLRFYTWAPDTLSLGYFQRPAEVRGRGAAGALVRRLTGGGAIHHARELTFSLTTDRTDPLYRGPLAPSYERVHLAVAEALCELGVTATLRGEQALSSEREGTGMCFHRSTPLDLVWDGRKGLGSAQRRRRGRVLHHGSLKLGETELDSGVAQLRAPDGGELRPEALAVLLAAAFERRLGIALEPAEPTADELADARARGARYVTPAWLGA